MNFNEIVPIICNRPLKEGKYLFKKISWLIYYCMGKWKQSVILLQMCGSLWKILNKIVIDVAMLVWLSFFFFLISGFEHNLSCSLGSSKGKSVFISKLPHSSSLPLKLVIIQFTAFGSLQILDHTTKKDFPEELWPAPLLPSFPVVVYLELISLLFYNPFNLAIITFLPVTWKKYFHSYELDNIREKVENPFSVKMMPGFFLKYFSL